MEGTTVLAPPTSNRTTSSRRAAPPPPQPRSSSSRYNDDDNKGAGTPPLNVQKTRDRAPPPPIPSSSSKPRTRPGRSNSDSSIIEGPGANGAIGSSSSKDRSYEVTSSSSSKPHRHKTTSGHRDKSKRTKKKVHTDTIDKLDVTGFFGPGSFHHDGPFDACNPSRNKVTNKSPVKAFPLDGANNNVSGVDPNKDKYATENRILCRDVDEAYLDYSKSTRRQQQEYQKKSTITTTAAAPTAAAATATNNNITNNDNNSTESHHHHHPPSHNQFPPNRAGTPSSENGAFDTSVKANPVHGDLTWGLGSSTFLDGTPAPKQTIAQESNAGGGLGRKKSLVQKLRGGGNGQGPAPPPRERRVQTENIDINNNNNNRPNSFDDNEMNSSSLPISKGRSTSPPEPQPQQQQSGGGGILRRVKSLKYGGSRRRAPS